MDSPVNVKDYSDDINRLNLRGGKNKDGSKWNSFFHCTKIEGY